MLASLLNNCNTVKYVDQFNICFTSPILRLAIFIFLSLLKRDIKGNHYIQDENSPKVEFEKNQKNFSVMELKIVLHVVRKVLVLTLTILKNQYMFFQLENLMYTLPYVAIYVYSHSISMYAIPLKLYLYIRVFGLTRDI